LKYCFFIAIAFRIEDQGQATLYFGCMLARAVSGRSVAEKRGLSALLGIWLARFSNRNMFATAVLAVGLGLVAAVLLALCLPATTAVYLVIGAAAILALGGTPALAAGVGVAAALGIWLYRRRF
jgi:hypothetical protein